MTCVSASLLDSLGVSHALLGGMGTAKGIILLLESTHPPALPVTLGSPTCDRDGRMSHLLPHLQPSRSTCWASLRSAIFTSCIVPCVSSSLPGVHPH